MFLPRRESDNTVHPFSVRRNASSSSRNGNSPASVVTFAPRKSSLSRPSNWVRSACFHLSPIGCFCHNGRKASSHRGNSHVSGHQDQSIWEMRDRRTRPQRPCTPGQHGTMPPRRSRRDEVRARWSSRLVCYGPVMLGPTIRKSARSTSISPSASAGAQSGSVYVPPGPV